MIEIASDDPLIERIAWIHEQIPKSYDSCYVTTELEVKLRTESIRLLMKYNHDRIIVVEKHSYQPLSGFILERRRMLSPYMFIQMNVAKDMHIGLSNM